MENLLIMVLEKNAAENFSKIYINAANTAQQLIFYINIEDLCMMEVDDIIDQFFRLRRMKQTKSEIIFYSMSPIGEDLINAIKRFKVDYMYCGEINNYALTVLSTLKRLNGFIPIIAIDCADEKWFDYALWAIQYKNRLFFYNAQNVDAKLMTAFLMHESINEQDIVNYKTVEDLILKQITTNSLLDNNLIYCDGKQYYNRYHEAIGEIDTSKLVAILPHKELLLNEECLKCNLKMICQNFNVGLLEIPALKNCELLKNLVSLAMINKDKKEFGKYE